MTCVMSSVTILGLNGRKFSQKVTRNTSILQVLEEACKKQNVNPGEYDLKHGNRSLDLSMTVGLANISNNALLELQPASKIRREGNVTVRIQLESGERLTGDFSPSSSIWDVVCHCLSQRNESPDHGDDGSSVAVCVYMRQVISGEEMKVKTLRSLGLTHGTAMFRLLYRQCDQLQEQAHVSSPLTKSAMESVSGSKDKTQSNEIDVSDVGKKPSLDKQEEEIRNAVREQCQQLPPSSQYSYPANSYSRSQTGSAGPQEASFIECSSETSSDYKIRGNICLPESVDAPGSQENELQSNNLKSADSTETTNRENSMDVDSISEDNESIEMEETGTVTIIGERNAMLFNTDDISSVRQPDLPDEFYEVTADDVRYLLAEYRRIRTEMENKPLELQSQRQNENLQRLARYAQTVIRVYFPERLVLQGVFSVHETVKSVEEFVRGFLENEKLNFYLYTTPPKVDLLPEKTLLEYELLPAARVHFGCEKHLRSYLKPSYRSQVSDPEAVSKAAAEFRNKCVSNIPSDLHDIHIDENVNVDINPQQDLDAPSTSSTHSLRRPHHPDSKTPKWMKLSKK